MTLASTAAAVDRAATHLRQARAGVEGVVDGQAPAPARLVEGRLNLLEQHLTKESHIIILPRAII